MDKPNKEIKQKIEEWLTKREHLEFKAKEKAVSHWGRENISVAPVNPMSTSSSLVLGMAKPDEIYVVAYNPWQKLWRTLFLMELSKHQCIWIWRKSEKIIADDAEAGRAEDVGSSVSKAEEEIWKWETKISGNVTFPDAMLRDARAASHLSDSNVSSLTIYNWHIITLWYVCFQSWRMVTDHSWLK